MSGDLLFAWVWNPSLDKVANGMIKRNTAEVRSMPAKKIAVTVDKDIIKQIDRLVREGKYRSRSKAVQDALRDIKNWRRKRLLEEVSKLDPKKERGLAEESLHAENEEWEKY